MRAYRASIEAIICKYHLADIAWQGWMCNNYQRRAWILQFSFLRGKMSSYIMTVRSVAGEKFGDAIGETQYLAVPDGVDPAPAHAIDRDKWFAAVTQAALWKNAQGKARGDLLFSVHGYDMTANEVIDRHRRLQNELSDCGFKGIVVSFDWPSDNKVLAYLGDRHKAKTTSMKLMSDGIAYLSENQKPDCPINVHALGHSTGAYVLREAFHDADDSSLQNGAWNVSQVILIAGDVSSDSMSAGNGIAQSIYRHSVRLTNYSNRLDEVLDISGIKRLGTAPRVGRIGLPDHIPPKAVNIDCTAYYKALDADPAIRQQDQPGGIAGYPSHSWYFGNRVFTKDLLDTLMGVDRQSIPTRTTNANGQLTLKRP